MGKARPGPLSGTDLEFVSQIINYVIVLFTVVIFARVILSFAVYFIRPPHPQWLVTLDGMITSITEPVLAPIRRMLPNMGGFDFSPMVVLVILWIIRAAVVAIGG